jgi:hypothetical protein
MNNVNLKSVECGFGDVFHVTLEAIVASDTLLFRLRFSYSNPTVLSCVCGSLNTILYKEGVVEKMPRSSNCTLRLCRIVGLLLMLLLQLNAVQAQSNYDNYGYDNDYSDPQGGVPLSQPHDSLYHDYAARQQDKELGAAVVGGYV